MYVKFEAKVYEMDDKQSKNAGNRGDRLKHAILIEVINRATQNNIWSYSESHVSQQ